MKNEIHPEGVRINKFLSEAGICSRREADRHIEAGEVTIDGKKAVMREDSKTGKRKNPAGCEQAQGDRLHSPEKRKR